MLVLFSDAGGDRGGSVAPPLPHAPQLRADMGKLNAGLVALSGFPSPNTGGGEEEGHPLGAAQRHHENGGPCSLRCICMGRAPTRSGCAERHRRMPCDRWADGVKGGGAHEDVYFCSGTHGMANVQVSFWLLRGQFLVTTWPSFGVVCTPMLYYTVLYCTVLYCTVLYCTVLL